MKKELKKIKQLFALLDDRAVCYCRWKSNQHLEAALAGTTDLDILVDEAQAVLCRQVLREFGCKQVVPQPGSTYPGIEDWLAFDEETGSLAHIHLHFRIIAGGRPKNYHLPLEGWLLSDCGRLQNLAIPAHEKELIVLIVRMAFKVRYLDLLRACLIPSYEFIPRGIRVELDWLLDRVQMNTIIAHLRASELPLDVSLILDFLERYAGGRAGPVYFFGLKRKLVRCMQKYMLQSPLRFYISSAALFFKSLVRSQTRKTLHAGVFFALVGADGSGKTRLTRDLAAWFRWKLETRTFYFGIPKSARMYVCFTKAKDLGNRLYRRFPGKVSGLVSRVFNAVLWIYVGWRRFGLSRQAKKYQAQGCVVLAERFPLRNFWTMQEPMDGPRLQEASGQTMLSGIERFFYKKIEMPDRLFVLTASVDVLHSRKKETPINRLREKVDAVNTISADEKTVIIDAEVPYENIVRAVKTNLWEML